MRRKDTKHCSKSLAAALCVTILIITIYTPPFFLDVTQQREKTLDHIYSAVNLSNRHIFTEYKITKATLPETFWLLEFVTLTFTFVPISFHYCSFVLQYHLQKTSDITTWTAWKNKERQRKSRNNRKSGGILLARKSRTKFASLRNQSFNGQ